jgi:hypothetical protein
MSSLEDLSPEARDELALIARQLAENPATRNDFLRMTKKVKPDITIDTIELEDKFEARQQQNNARIEELQAKLMEKEALETLERRRQALIKSGKASSDEDVEKIEKIMLEKGIQNHETAADYWQWMNKASEPTGQSFYNPSVLNEAARDTLANFWKNPQRAARDEAAKAMQELRKGTRIGL